ncbi:hypothetical protein GGI07_003910 [Coemansia sp. Benny D115]|nr:hypothetical protein GGI07_003910 [Coemansia sp. Benny D115]
MASRRRDIQNIDSPNINRLGTHATHIRSRRRVEPHGLPEYLYYSYERLVDVESSSSDLPLLTDGQSGREISYVLFKELSSVLAYNLTKKYNVVPGDVMATLAVSNIDMPVVAAASWLLRANAESDGEGRFERPPLTADMAQEVTAVHYYNHLGGGISVDSTDGGGGGGQQQHLEIHVNSMSHANVISFYKNALRRSPSLPNLYNHTRSRSPNTRLPPSSSREAPSSIRRESSQRRPNLESSGSAETAFTVFRVHWAYRLHSTVMNIFHRGAMYVVAAEFDPWGFAELVYLYKLCNAELTFAEIRALIEFLKENEDQRYSLNRGDGSSVGVAEMLSASLRFIYTESESAESQLGPLLNDVLSDTRIVRTRFGSYVEPPERNRMF